MFCMSIPWVYSLFTIRWSIGLFDSFFPLLLRHTALNVTVHNVTCSKAAGSGLGKQQPLEFMLWTTDRLIDMLTTGINNFKLKQNMTQQLPEVWSCWKMVLMGIMSVLGSDMWETRQLQGSLWCDTVCCLLSSSLCNFLSLATMGKVAL